MIFKCKKKKLIILKLKIIIIYLIKELMNYLDELLIIYNLFNLDFIIIFLFTINSLNSIIFLYHLQFFYIIIN